MHRNQQNGGDDDGDGASSLARHVYEALSAGRRATLPSLVSADDEADTLDTRRSKRRRRRRAVTPLVTAPPDPPNRTTRRTRRASPERELRWLVPPLSDADAAQLRRQVGGGGDVWSQLDDADVWSRLDDGGGDVWSQLGDDAAAYDDDDDDDPVYDATMWFDDADASLLSAWRSFAV